MKSLAIIISHPIQYYVPLFKLLAQHYNLKVFYTWGEEGSNAKYDPGFKKPVAWDIPLLEGYTYEFLTNAAKDAGSHHFNGIVNPDLIEKVKAFQPDAILVYGWAYKSHLKLLRHFKGKIPIWFRGDSTLLDEKKGIKQILRTLFLKRVYRNVDKALHVGSESKKYFRKFGIKEKDLIFVPHAVDNERFAVDRSKEAQQIRASLNIKHNDILVLFAGKLEHKKNPMLLLEAFIELDLLNVHLLFVGSGELEESIKFRVLSLGSKVQSTESFLWHNKSLKERIHFMDFQNQTQMPAVYQACDLFCLPSQGPGETWGLAVNEAMACGKAVLVSDKVG
ncbi:MAG: glycosyltransferase, partial [Pedobacter sp.]